MESEMKQRLLALCGVLCALLLAASPAAAIELQGFTFPPAVTALSTTAAIVLPSGSYVARIICNDDASIAIYIGASNVTAAGANGVKLSAGQCWDVSHTTAAIYAVSASGTPNARGVQY